MLHQGRDGISEFLKFHGKAIDNKSWMGVAKSKDVWSHTAGWFHDGEQVLGLFATQVM